MRRGIFIAVLVASVGARASLADWKADVGYTALKTRLGTSTPTGAGIDAAQVEARQSGNYMPDVNNAQFAGKTISARSGNSGVSNHATTVASYYYGLTGSVSTQRTAN